MVKPATSEDAHSANSPSPGKEQHRVTAGQFERANQVIATGNFDYGIGLLLSCCTLEPANLAYRQALRRAEKVKYRNNLRGSWFAWLTTWRLRARQKAALRVRDYLKVLELGEQILSRNPWEVGTQMRMGEAADALGFLDLAVWCMDQARQKKPQDVAVNRRLAELFEKRGEYKQAIALWSLVGKLKPGDAEVDHKLKDLAVHDTITRGHYEQGAEPSLLNQGSSAEHLALRVGKASGEEADSSFLAGTVSRGGAADQEAASLRSRIKANPRNENLYLDLARLYRKVGEAKEAQAVLEQGLGPTDNSFLLASELAEVKIERYRRKLSRTEEKLKAAPDDPALRERRQQLCREITNRELQLYQQKAERYPNVMSYRYELGVRLAEATRLNEAISHFQAAREDPRYRSRALEMLARCFKRLNHWRLAKRNFEDALAGLEPTDTSRRKELLFELALGYAEEGDLARAVDLAHELANIDFSYRNIGSLLDDWQTRLQGKVPS